MIRMDNGLAFLLVMALFCFGTCVCASATHAKQRTKTEDVNILTMSVSLLLLRLVSKGIFCRRII